MEVNQYNYPPSKIRHAAEACYARKLLSEGTNYYYQPIIQLSVGVFHPDFYLTHTKVYVEIVGSRQALHQAKRKIALFRQQHPDKILLLLDRNGHPWKQRSHVELEEALQKARRIIRYEQAQNGLTPREIKKLRKDLGLTQKQFAKVLGGHGPMVSVWENGVHKPHKKTTELILALREEENKKNVALA